MRLIQLKRTACSSSSPARPQPKDGRRPLRQTTAAAGKGRKILLLLPALLLLFWCLMLSGPAQAAETSSVSESSAASASAETERSLVVGVPTDRCPLIYRDSATGSITGIGVELLRKAAEYAHYSLVFTPLDEGETLKDALDDTRFDIVMPFGAIITSSSGKSMLITYSLFESPFSFAVLPGKELDPEESLHIGMIQSMAGVAETIQARYPGYTITLYEDQASAVNALRRGEVDGLLASTYLWTYFLQKPSWSDLQLLPAAAISMSFFIGASDSPEHRTIIGDLNSGILQISATQRQSTILAYTSRSLYQYTLSDTLYKNRFLMLAAASLIILILLFSARENRQHARYIRQLLLANKSLEEANRKLEDANVRLGQAAEAEISLRRQADAANNAKTEFLSRMSHDIRTPLNVILGTTYLAAAHTRPEQTAEDMKKIETSSRFLLSLINDVLDMAKAESGKIELHPEPYTPAEFDDYVRHFIMPLCQANKLQFVSDFQLVPEYIPLADKTRTNQILFNLLSNAAKFTPAGGTITLRIREQRTAAGRLALEASVGDTGIGISREFQDKLYDAFTQERRNDTAPNRGSGLGLAIVKKLVDLMGGTITVDSEPGKGTVFTVCCEFDCLPASGSAAGRTEPEPDYSSLAGRRILLCEDHPMNLEIARAILESRQILVDTAADGQAGLEHFQASSPGWYDCILMDIRMPVMDGYEAAAAIRRLDRADADSVPIIAMTADAFAEDVRKCLEAGMNGHIRKPVEPDIMFRTILGALEQRESRL